MSHLLNWSPEKGNPYDYEISTHKDVISKDTEWEIVQQEPKFKKRGTVDFCHHLKTMASLDFKHTDLLIGLDRDENNFEFSMDDYIDIKKPITVWITYPFGEIVKATIYPCVRIFDKKEMTLSGIGYLAWQIARVYAEIYKNHAEQVGVWGHGFDDLYLEEIEFCEDNNVTLGIGS